MSAWDSAPILDDQSEAWKSAPADEPKKPPSLFDDFSQHMHKFLPAPYQAAIGAATGFGGMVAGGIGGLGRTILSGPEEGAKASERIRNALTFEPSKEEAKQALHYAGKPMEWLDNYGKWAGGHAEERGASPGVATAFETAPHALAQVLGMRLPGAKASAFEAALPGGELPWTPAKRAAAMAGAVEKDAASAAARNAKFALPPEDVNPSIGNRILTAAAGRDDLLLELSGKNQPKMQAGIREDLRLHPDQPLNAATYKAVIKREAPAYEELRNAGWGDPRIKVPEPKLILDQKGNPLHPFREIDMPSMERAGLKATDDFRRDVGKRTASVREKLGEHPEGFGALAPSLKLLEEQLAKKEFNPDHAVDLIQQLRRDADIEINAPKSATVEMAHTKLQVAKDLEHVIEQNLMEKNDFKTLARFRDARTQIRKAYEAKQATLPSGEINAQEYSAMKADDVPLTGAGADIAHLYDNFPGVTQIPSRTGMAPALNAGDVSTALISHAANPRNWWGKVVAGSRAPLRSLIKTDAYQRNFVNPPTYEPGFGSRLVRGLQKPANAPVAESLSDRRRELLMRLLEQGAAQ